MKSCWLKIIDSFFATNAVYIKAGEYFVKLDFPLKFKYESEGEREIIKDGIYPQSGDEIYIRHFKDSEEYTFGWRVMDDDGESIFGKKYGIQGSTMADVVFEEDIVFLITEKEYELKKDKTKTKVVMTRKFLLEI